MLLDIVTYPDARLKRIAEPVTEVTDDLRTLVKNMADTMYDAHGVGLAAPQVGENIRLIVMDISGPEERTALQALINPTISTSGPQICSEAEGCLSVPHNYRSEVLRYARVHLKYQDLDGNLHEDELEDYPAIVVQHEMDHLDGKLFIDHISRLRRSLYDAKVKKWIKRNAD